MAEDASQLVPVQGRHLGYTEGRDHDEPANEAGFMPGTLNGNRLDAVMETNMPSETEVFYRAAVHYKGAEYLGDIMRFTTPYNENPPEYIGNDDDDNGNDDDNNGQD